MKKLAVIVLLLSACAVPLTPVAELEPQAYLPLTLNGYTAKTHGIAGADPWGLLADDWYYTWAVGASISDPHYVRMVWCLDDFHLALYTAQIIQAADNDHAAGVVRTWLIGNEPDNDAPVCDINAQCGAYPLTGNPFDPDNPALKVWQAPEQYAERYAAMYDLIKAHDPHAVIFAGGVAQLSSTATQAWWTRFVLELRRRGELHKVMGVHVHAYPVWSTGACNGWCMPELETTLNMWYTEYHEGLGLSGIPIWITEVGAGPFCQRYTPFDPVGWEAIRDNVLLPFRQWFDSTDNPGYASMAWFIPWWGGDVGVYWWCDFLIDARTLPVHLTPLGEVYP